MRYAITSDVHANLPAWNAVLKDISGLKVDHIINLGDIIGYGPSPSEVLSSVKAHASASVIGNHDAVCADRLDPSIFNENARAVINWTKDQLDEDATQYLKEMHDMLRPEGTGFLITHAEVISPFNFSYIIEPEDAAKNFAECEDAIIFIGHTHFPGVFVEGENGRVTHHTPLKFQCNSAQRYIINPGSVGDPRSPDISASYCIFDSETQKVEFRRVKFDVETYRQLFTASGLTSKPYFLRYLDGLKSNNVQMKFPNVGDSDQSQPKTLATTGATKAPYINLGATALNSKTPKKTNLALTVTILFLLLGAGVFTWLKLESSEAETAEKTPITKVEQDVEKVKPVAKIEAKPLSTKLPVTGRYLRISEPKGPYLSIAEIEVLSGEQNVALKKKATQSSNFSKTMLAHIGTDGNRQGSAKGSFTHTTDKLPIWWEVDLGAEYPISQITIWNRDNIMELWLRLDGFTLDIFNAKRELVYKTKNNPGATKVIQIK